MNAPLAKEQIALLMSDSLTYRTPMIHGTDNTVAEPRLSMFAAMMQRVSVAVKGLAAIPGRRAVLGELSMLSDRELADIGLTRSELTRVFDPRFTHE